MPVGDDKTTVAAVISIDLKNRLKDIAKHRRWSLSQATGALIEDCLDHWEKSLGIEPEKSSIPKTSKKKSVS